MSAMQPPSVSELLNFWEYNINQTLIRRAVDILCLAYPGIKVNEIAALCIGERDARLLLFRELMFGRQMRNMAACPECSEKNEWETDTRDLLVQLPEASTSPGKYIIKEKGYAISYRLPDSTDISKVIDEDKNTGSAGRLLTKLVLDCKFKNKPCEIQDIPVEILDELDREIEKKNQQADIRMIVQCVNCNHEWEVQFDIVSYLWSEIDDWARHILQDISVLAYTYGWSEKDILNMSPARRQIYLDMINS